MVRWKVIHESWKLQLRAEQLTREEDEALRRAGKDFHAALAGRGRPLAAPVAAALARVTALEEHARALPQRLDASLAADRRDYRATSSTRTRWLIVARGVVERMALREDARRARRDLVTALEELGARVVSDPTTVVLLDVEHLQRLASTRTALERTLRARAKLLTPLGRSRLPRWARFLTEDLVPYAMFVRDELPYEAALRLPVLAAMASAWWITRGLVSATPSAPSAPGEEGRASLSPDSLGDASVWLPLLAAGLVAYLCVLLAKRVERRYGESESPALPATEPSSSP